jgi:hypothetical protein
VHLSDHLDEQALSARLASMEQSGAFGPKNGKNGISIPNKKDVSPTYGSSLRVAMINNVGSLEAARQVDIYRNVDIEYSARLTCICNM